MSPWLQSLFFCVIGLLCSQRVACIETNIGGVYSSDAVLTLAKSPFVVTKDLIVSEKATLTIEAGVQMNFQARVRFIVNGTVKAEGTREREISMRHFASAGIDSDVLRLVGGNSSREGRIEVYDAASGSWGTVCNDNWSVDNARVVCRHLGFNNPIGSDYSTRRFGPGTGIIGLSNVHCDGAENSLLDCSAERWNRSRCNHFEDVGLVCGKGSVGFWGGIVFASGGASESTVNGARVFSTSSVLKNVRILRTGVVPDEIRRSQPDQTVAAITADTALAEMVNVTISSSRSSNIQLNDVHADLDIENLKVLNCTGFGLSGRSSRRLKCVNCHFDKCRIDLTRIALPLARPEVEDVSSYDFGSIENGGSTESHFVNDSGGYINFTQTDMQSRYVTHVLETDPGFGMTISFDEFLLQAPSSKPFRIYDNYTGFDYLQLTLSPTAHHSIPDSMTVDYHQVIFYFHSSIYGNARAYVSRHRLDSRQVDLINCSTGDSSARLPWGTYGLQFRGFLGIVYLEGYIDWYGGMHIVGQGHAVEIVSTVIQCNKARGCPIYGVFLGGAFTKARMLHSRLLSTGGVIFIFETGNGDVAFVQNIINGSNRLGFILYMSRGSGQRTFLVERNVLTRVLSAALSISSSLTVGSLIVRNNIVSFCTGNVAIGTHGDGLRMAASISGNIIESNHVPPTTNVFSVYTEDNLVTIEQNFFKNNKGRSIVLLYDRNWIYYPSKNVLFFRNNTLKGNTVYNQSETRKPSPTAILDIKGGRHLQVYGNEFDNPDSSFEVCILNEATSSLDKINVTLNYWGTNDEKVIRERIYDFYDSNYFATATYCPFLLSPDPQNVTKLLCGSFSSPLGVGLSGEIGGQLNSTLTLSDAMSPYLMTRDVTILPAGKLIIEAGVVIEAREYTGILVEGSMMSLGTADRPVVIRAAASSVGDIRFIDRILQIYFEGEWRSICFPTNQGFNNDLYALARSSCRRVGYNNMGFYRQDWFPQLDTPVITSVSCPLGRDTPDPDDCSFVAGLYTPALRCLSRLSLRCTQYGAQAIINSRSRKLLGKWAGIRFSATSTISVSGNDSHTLPTSSLFHTLIQNAGRSAIKNVPAVKSIFRSPKFVNLTITDCASTGLMFEYLHEKTNISGVVVEDGGGDGISVRGPNLRSVTYHDVTIRNVVGAGMYSYSPRTSPIYLTNYQSICLSPPTLYVDEENGIYIGLHPDDHIAGKVCSVVLRGPPNTVLFVTVAFVQLLSDDKLVIRNGPNEASPSLRTYEKVSLYYRTALSASSSVYVELTSGGQNRSSRFSLHTVALSTRESFNRGDPNVAMGYTRILDSYVFSAKYGVNVHGNWENIAIRNLRTENCSTYGIYVSRNLGILSITNSAIRNSHIDGIRTSQSWGNVQIINNEVTGSADVGIRIGDDCDWFYARWTSIIESNVFLQTGNTAVNIFLGSGRAGCKWKVMKNFFDANENGLLFSSFRDVYLYYYLTIADNTFRNHTGTALEFDEFVNVYARIESNTFATNFGESIYLRGRTPALSVARNLFFSNVGKYVVVLSSFNFTKSPFVFENNTLIGNVIDPTKVRPSDFGCPSVVALLTSSQVVIRGNEFNNPESRFELSIQLPVQSSSELTVDVRRNYWGTTSEAEIRDRICDFGQTSRLASADFIPYLMSANGSVVSSNVSEDESILRPQRLLRGRVVADTVITLDGSPFTVTGDISVLPGRTLTIEAGTEIRFVANSGILVEGRLVARGTESQPIRFVGHGLTMPNYKRNVRLYGGTSMNEGIVQVYYNKTWGAVCALQDKSDVHSTSHNFLLSNVVCKEIGYKGAVKQQSQSLYSNKSYSGDAWIEHLLCRGSETSMRSCINFVHERSVCALGALQVVCVKTGSTFWNDRSPLYWSGIRFSKSASLNVSHVIVSEAGFADGVKIPAILSVGSAMEMNDVNVTDNAWTGIDVVNAPVANLNRLSVSSNKGTGLRLSNTLDSALHNVMAVGNDGHGLALARDGFLQPFWHYPVETRLLLDVCTQSGPVSVKEPFYLKFVPRLSGVGAYSQVCTVLLQANMDYVLSFSVVSLHFQNANSYVKIDGQNVYSSRKFQFPDQVLHHVTSGSSASVSIYVSIDIEDFVFNPWADYALIYVQKHFTEMSNSSSHVVTNGWFASNLISGVAFNSSRSTYDRSTVSIFSSTILDNSWNGIDGNMTSGDSPSRSLLTNDVKILRNTITGNGKSNASAGGVSLCIDHVNVSIQNNGIADNVGGAVSINLTTSRSESTLVNVFDNRIVRNREGDILKVRGSSLSSGVTVNIGSNTVSHNSGGIQFDTLAINRTAAVVSQNTFYNNTGRFVVSWETGQRSSVPGQDFVNNTLYWNVCQKPDYRWSVYAVGIGPSYSENTFDNPSNSYELASGPDAGQGAHKATENWWDTPDLSEAAKRVRDKSDVPSLADVDIFPVKSVPPLNANKGCPFGWVREDRYHLQCYLYVRSAVDWYTANEFCKARHATLASSHSGSVDAFLNDLVPQASFSSPSVGSWLGLRRNEKQVWFWSDGSKVDYDYWIEKMGEENCAKLTSTGWSDEECSSRLPFYCIKPPADGCPNSCSQRGRCVNGNCLCSNGWKGSEDCSAFDCTNVNNCSGRGKCVGPNQCRCRVGWKGRACTTTYCNLHATCHSCTRQPGCGWCDSQQRCLPGLGVGSDTEQCEAWFYYGCFAPSRMINCSERIRLVNCLELCGKSPSNETEQHCSDIDRCYFNNTSCSGWNEFVCPYGRVTPDYGLDADVPKIPSHLPKGTSNGRGKRSPLDDSSASDRRKKFVDLHRDVRVVDPSITKIYRLITTEVFTYYVVKPPLEKIFVGEILASRQSGGVLDKVLAMSTAGQYQFVKANPAKLEEVFKFADFIDSVSLEDIYGKTAVELIPNVDALQSSNLPGALHTAIISPSTSIYKCKRSAKNDRIVIATRKNQASALTSLTLGVVSHATSGFLEKVTAIHVSGLLTIVHTTLAICSSSSSRIKLDVNRRNGPQAVVSPIATGVGGNGVEGMVIYENILPSDLDLSVGDVIVGRPTGPVAGYVVDYYNSYDDVVTFIELDHASGVGVAPCASGRASRWCDLTKGSLVYHEIIKLGDVTSNTVVNYSPQIQMTFRSNHTSPFVSKLGFVFDGSITIGSQTNLSLSAKDLDGVLDGQTHGNDHQQFFCIDIGPTCIRGKLTVSVEYMFHLDYNLAKHGAEFLFAYEAESRGSLRVGSIWRNGVGLEYIKQADFHSIQKLIRHPHQSSSFESSVVPKFAIEWPMSHKTEPYVKSAIPDFMKMALSSPSAPFSESKFFLEVIPALRGHFVTKRCYEGCDFGKKLLASLLSGVHEVEVYSSVDLLFFDTSRIYKWQSADFVNVVSGLCLPVDDESDCSCQCPFEGKCSNDEKGVKICQTCDCGGLPGCSCRRPCSNGTVEASSSSNAQPECLCQCADFKHASVGVDGKCQCGCTCADGSRSVIGPNGTCECACKCKNCMDSFFGPSGCICPEDKCPTCSEGLEAVWQDCTCSCQSKHGRGGLPPVCSEGWTGPYCDIPDCCPVPFCSGNGVCVNPAGSEIDIKPYCLCTWPPWEGELCEININDIVGDPHMQTLDGFNYDFFDIGEFWYCKSVSNDFGVSARFYKYKRTSLTGAVAVKAGTSVVTVSTLHSPGPNDLPLVRVNGLITRLNHGSKLTLPDDSVHVEPSLFLNGTSKEKLALIAFQFSNGVGLSLDIQYSPVMQRQFINIAFLVGSSFKRTTEGLCGFMDGNVSNDLVGSDGVLYPTARVLEFAKSWKISQTFDGSGLNGTWSWNHSNFHKDDTMDSSYTDPLFVPVYNINDIDSSTTAMAEDLCKQKGLNGVRLTECIFDVAITNDTSLAEQEDYQTGCPTRCFGKGRCVNATCVCSPGWFGHDCSLGFCSNCSINGDCVSGFCQCHFGWDGPLCDEPATCYDVDNCTNPFQGLCKSRNVCQCSAGFTGSSCSELANCTLLRDCYRHGVCIDHNKCKCDVGWAGVDCAKHSCEAVGYCSNHGSCVGYDVCKCDEGWSGSGCAIPSCTNRGNCSGNGECSAPNTCDCYAGFSGQDCELPNHCPELNDCSGNGVCQGRNRRKYCLCYSGYEGKNCSLTSCKGQNDCSGRGTCAELDLCECFYGYTGSDCSKYSCEKRNFCSGHGRCLRFDICTCDAKWSGLDCSVPDCTGVNNCGNASTGVCVGSDMCDCTQGYDGDRCDQLAGDNLHAPAFNSSSLRFYVSVSAAVGHRVAAVSAEDSDMGRNGRITYSLTSSTGHHAFFKVNAQTGEIFTTAILDGHLGSELHIITVASDGGSPSLSGSVDVSVKVISPNLHCPVFIGLPLSIEIEEALAAPRSLILLLNATDADSDASPNGEIEYSLGPDSSDVFHINSSSGSVTLLNYLTLESYVLNVIASDKGQPSCSTKGSINFGVRLSNRAPSCISPVLIASVPYATPPGSVLFSLKAVDLDNGTNGQLNYTLTNFHSSVLQRDQFFLRIDSKAEIILDSALSKPTGGVFDMATFSVTAQDQAVEPKSCNFDLTLTVFDEFTFAHPSHEVKINESVPIGFIVNPIPSLLLRTSLNSSTISYKLYNAELLPYSVDKKTGILSVIKALDYEKEREHNVTVIAVTTDIPGALAVAIVRVRVINVNDNAPQFTQNQYFATVDELAQGGELILKLSATDLDSGFNRSAIGYEMLSVSPSSSRDTFDIRLTSDAIGIYLSHDAVINYQILSKFTIVMKTWDKELPKLFSKATVVVTVKEAANAKKPVFFQRQYRAELNENSPFGFNVVQVIALVNGRPSDDVKYTIQKQTLNPGSGSSVGLEVTPGGVIRVANSSEIDYETIRGIDLTILATVDHPVLRTSEASVLVSILDVNDNSPVFEEMKYNVTIPLDYPEGQVFLDVTASDSDSGTNGEIVYSLVSSGHQKGICDINPLSGTVFLSNELDWSSYGTHKFTATASDKGTPRLSGSSTIYLNITCPLSSPDCSKTSSPVPAVYIIGGVGGFVILLIIISCAVVLVKGRKREKDSGENAPTMNPPAASQKEFSSEVCNPVFAGEEVSSDLVAVPLPSKGVPEGESVAKSESQ